MTQINKSYSDFRCRVEKEVHAFPMKFAFSDKQFEEVLTYFNIKKEEASEKLFSITGGGFIRKTDSQALTDMGNRHYEELKKAMLDDSFLINAIEYELANHEYCITYDETDTVNVLDLDLEDLRVVKCFQIARKNYLNSGVCD